MYLCQKSNYTKLDTQAVMNAFLLEVNYVSGSPTTLLRS